MKKISECIPCCIFLMLTFLCSVCWAYDFSQMSNQDLFELRGAIHNASEKDRVSYQNEWEKRVSGMTDEEKKRYVVPPPEEVEAKPKAKVPFHIMGQGYEPKKGEGEIIFGGGPPKKP